VRAVASLIRKTFEVLGDLEGLAKTKVRLDARPITTVILNSPLGPIIL
jgi:hypothetical protein